MNKLKKVCVGLIGIVIGGISKIIAMDVPTQQPKYGIYEPPKFEETTVWEKILSIGKYAVPVILFFIGVFTLLSKKLSKKTKIIVGCGLIILAIYACVIMKHFIY